MNGIRSATDLEAAFAQLLLVPVREVVKIYEFFEEDDEVVARQLPGIYLNDKEWRAIHTFVRERGGRNFKDDGTGQWFLRFPKAAAPSATPLSQAPNQQLGPGEAAAAGQPANVSDVSDVHSVDNVDNVADEPPVAHEGEGYSLKRSLAITGPLYHGRPQVE